jgi:putative hemolysin
MGNGVIIGLVVGASLVLSFLFSGMEAGVLALNRLRIRQLMRSGKRSAQLLHEFLEKPEDFLWTILIGNTLANFFAIGLLVVLLFRGLGGQPVLLLLSYVVLIFLEYTFCELLPKMLFRSLPNRLTLLLAVPFRTIHVVLSPAVQVMNWLAEGLLHWTGGKTFTGHLFATREEMRLVMQESAQGLTSEERIMINRVLDFQNLTVREVMIPMPQVATLTVESPMSEALKLAQDRRLTRFPVWRAEGRGRRIVGVLSLRAVLYAADIDPAKRAGDYVKPALYLEEDLRSEDALKRMQRSGHRLGIVLGRDRQEVGIVSLQDILKVIFGEVRL